MPMWRCPHCGTPQAETARCWVCHRSSTACCTCRHYRRSVAAQLGYCGLDRKREPLTGDEIRGCWEAWPADATQPDMAPTIAPARPITDQHPQIEFIEVSARAPVGVATARVADVASPTATATGGERVVTPPLTSDEPGWSLWAELER